MRIAFLGTPDFAVPSLQALYAAGHQIVAVYTQPDKPKGRGGKLAQPPVKEWAIAHELPVFQPKRIRHEKWIAHLQELDLDVMVTAAFGQILSEADLGAPRYGCVNVHGSLLPQYRGPAPIQWALIKGEPMTGVTTMLTDAGIDTGDCLLKEEVPILPEDTSETLSQRMAVVGAELLVETLARLEAGNLVAQPQEEALATYYPMLKKEDGHIDWNQKAGEIVNLIRGVDPWPGAYAQMPSGVLKIWKARQAEGAGPAGQIILSHPKQGLKVACSEGAIEILELQAPGGKRMKTADFLRGKASLLPEGMDFS